jgi:hypothetical protein
MKFYLLTTALVFIATVTFSAPDSVFVARCHSYCTDIHDGFDSYDYAISRFDSAGHLLSADHFTDYSDPYTPYSSSRNRVTYNYNNSGHVASEIEEQWTDSGWTQTLKHGYSYDVNNNRISDTLILPLDSITLYGWSYGPLNDITSKTTSYWNGASFTTLDSSVFVNDGVGRPIEWTEYFNTGNVNRIYYTYDSFGNIVVVLSGFLTGNVFHNSYQNLSQYNSSDFLEASSNSFWNDTTSTWDVQDTMHTIFNLNNRPVELIRAFYSPTFDSSAIIYAYDVNDSVVQINNYHFSSPPPSNDSLSTFITRDASGNVIDSLTLYYRNGIFWDRRLWHYDNANLPNGKDLYVIICDSVSCNDTLYHTIYTYDNLGRLNTSYIYDSDGNLSRDLGILYDSLSHIINHFTDDYDPNSPGHLSEIYLYDANGFNYGYSNSYTGSTWTTKITDCNYSAYLDTGNLHVQVFITPDSTCTGISRSGYILILGGHSPYQIAWSDTTGIRDPFTIMPTFIPTSSVTYSLTVSDATGDSVILPVPMPTRIFNFNMGPDTTVCNGTPVTLTAPAGFNSYSWFDGNTGMSTVFMSSIPIQQWTWVTAIDNNYHCQVQDSLLISVNVCSSINEYAVDDGYKLFTTDEAVRIVFSDAECKGDFTLYSVTGNKICGGTFDHELIILTATLSKGIYILKVSSSDCKNESIVIER